MRSSSLGQEPRSPRSCSPNCSASWPHPSSGWAPGSSPTRPLPRSKSRSTRRRLASSRPCNARCGGPTFVADFIIRIPRVSVAVSEAELTDFLIDAGEHVEEGTPLYVIATEKAEQEIEAGASGTVQWTGRIGITYDIGAEIGVITS